MATTTPALAERMVPLAGPDFERRFLDLVGDARVVLLGESTHGTHEFYRERARLSLLLARERGFGALALEADWPDAYRLNRWVRGAGRDRDAAAALGGFTRFPAWMWRNREIAALAERLRRFNLGLPAERRVGVYGLDLYSLHRSMAAVVAWLAISDPAAAGRAREAYACFDAHGADPQGYGLAAASGLADCERQAASQLVAVRERAARAVAADGLVAEDEAFCAERNAVVAVEAERYYRTMWGGRVDSWNLRDGHMADTAGALLEHLAELRGAPARVVVWAHNSHLGDARATEAAGRDEIDLGQLLRERFGRAVVSIGFTTGEGEVMAAHDWDLPGERMRLRPPLPDSHERAMSDAGAAAHLLPLRDDPELAAAFAAPRLERFIGVVYRPLTERASHYQRCRLRGQFDAVIHIDRTRAVDPLEVAPREADDLVPETWPSGV